MTKINHEQYWAKEASKLIWREPWQSIFSGDFAHPQWFVGGKLNITETCLDQHAISERADKAAIIWESEDKRQERVTYQELQTRVCALAKGLRALGAQSGDRIAIYMPLCPNAIVAMLACARIGTTHTVVFAGFSANSLSERLDDSSCRFVITADGFLRKGQIVALKPIVDDAIAQATKGSVRYVVVLKHAHTQTSWTEGRDVDWEECLKNGSGCSDDPEIVDAEHPLFILYTSGTTGKPKGIVHSSGGYLTQVRTTCEAVFGLNDQDVYWCTADIGWITGHSYVVYGPLALGATVFIYEGALTSPTPDRLFELIDEHRVSILYTAPTAIRMFMQMGPEIPAKHHLGSLRLLGSVGEPINPEAWNWWHRHVGHGRCPLVDTWWQTETGAIMISPIPGKVETKPGCATLPMPGLDIDVVDAQGVSVAAEESGYLVVNQPWPSMARGIYGDQARFEQNYFARFPGKYFSGDGARKDRDGYIWILGRVDDVVNISGHRLGTAEIESALITHPDVAESAVVSKPDPLTGEAIVAFVILKYGATPSDGLKAELIQCVGREIGAFARPKEIVFTPSLPKTRSGKIMRRVLRQMASGQDPSGDLSTIENLEFLKAQDP
jgi:acetyl-CoA synthetase